MSGHSLPRMRWSWLYFFNQFCVISADIYWLNFNFFCFFIHKLLMNVTEMWAWLLSANQQHKYFYYISVLYFRWCNVFYYINYPQWTASSREGSTWYTLVPCTVSNTKKRIKFNSFRQWEFYNKYKPYRKICSQRTQTLLLAHIFEVAYASLFRVGGSKS